MLERIHPFAVAGVIGLLIGIERERSHPEGVQAVGVRSFVLFGLLGTLAADLANPPLEIGLTAFCFGSILIGYFRSTARTRSSDIGVTTELSAAAVYGIGYLTASEPKLGVVLGMAVLVVLASRQWLHRFVRQTLQPGEIRSAIFLLFVAVFILPFCPDRPVDPWGLVNPRRLALLTELIALMQFAGYITQRLFGRHRGMLFSGFLGGLVSSTVVFATMPAQVKAHPRLLRAASGAATLAVMAALIEFVLIVVVGEPALLLPIGLPVLAMIVCGGLITGVNARGLAQEGSGKLPTSNPIELKAVVKLTGFIGLLFSVVALAHHSFGTAGAAIANFLGGLFELHGAALATTLLFKGGQLSFTDVQLNLGVALVASFISKFVLLWSLGFRSPFAVRVTLNLVSMLVVGGLVYWLVYRQFAT